MTSFEGKVALVTGGAASFGLATIYAFAKVGASPAASFMVGHAMVIDGGILA